MATKQRELKERLAAAVREREGLRNAADETAKKRANDLADETASVRKGYETLERERADAERKALTARNSELAGKQKTLAQDSARVAAKAKASSASSGSTPPNPGSATSAAEKFESGDPLGAMAEQESAARELDRAALEGAKLSVQTAQRVLISIAWPLIWCFPSQIRSTPVA